MEEAPVNRNDAATAEAVPLVGVGASAGGLEAFQDMLAGARPDMALAIVLVQHLDPNHESLLAELLGKRCAAPVVTVEDGMEARAGTIFLIPPGAALRVEGSTLRLDPFDAPRGQRRPIDTFLESLAAERGPAAACVILSGTGSDGSVGAKAVKEAGGLVLAQTPGLAKYEGMPEAAIATGSVDLVLPPGDMIDVLGEHFRRSAAIDSRIETDAEFLRRVVKHVRYRTGHDFSNYKTGTLKRRLARRMSVLGIREPTEYLQRLIADAGEGTQLMHDILINVTGFFRDRAAFEALRTHAIAPMLAQKAPGEEVRVWVPGCSTGQEAYTVAMILAEERARIDADVKISVFATDIDEPALETARQAFYDNTIVDEVPRETVDAHFQPARDGFRVANHVRGLVNFSVHNLVQDPPFSRLDLVACRNVLIYLDDELQEHVLSLFHYALKEGGFLFLGQSETLGRNTALFAEVAGPERLYRRLPGERRLVPLPAFGSRTGGPRPVATASERKSGGEDGWGRYGEIVLARHAPAFVVVDDDRQVIFSSPRTGRFLELAGGRPNLDVVELARGDLELALRSLLALGLRGPGEVRRRSFVGTLDGEDKVRLDLVMERLEDERTLIVFQDRLELGDEAPPTETGDAAIDAGYVRALEVELEQSRQTVRTTVEELETSNEELKSSNEEMMSMNEELQSANEELATINDELQDKVAELDRANDDLVNLVEGTAIATVFLDTDLSIRTFTPDARRYFRLKDEDKGRPLADLAGSLDVAELVAVCEEVRKRGDLRQLERETRGGDEALMIRVKPYRTGRGESGGVVLTLTPVTELKNYARRLEAAEAEARRALGEVEELYRASPQAMGLLDPKLSVIRANARFAEIAGGRPEDQIGRTLAEVLPGLADVVVPAARKILETGEPAHAVVAEGETAEWPEERRIFETDWYPVRDDGGITAVGMNFRDVTVERRMEADLRRVMRELQHRVKNMLANVTALANQAIRDRRDPEEALRTLQARIRALANTHSLLTEANWGATRFRDVVENELVAVYGTERITVRGPDVRLNARATLALGMALHELATNAAKYGALSAPEGRLELTWARMDEGEGERFVLHWTERDGPAVTAPEGGGFGSRLIESLIRGPLDGRFRQSFEPEGFSCVVDVDMTAALREEDEHAHPDG